jgi:hypothetical protein
MNSDGTGARFQKWSCAPMFDLPDAETLEALSLVVTSIAGAIGALATLVWNWRRKP